MRLVVGLGNPGKEYEKTRHNVGFMFLDKCAEEMNFTFSKEKFGGLFGEKIIDGEKIIFLKPQRYINLSGEVIKKYIDFYKININDVLIICDDLHIEIGNFKLRYKGSSAGHNGLKNIENHLQTREYKRIKIGISSNKDKDMKDYVLGSFSQNERDQIIKIISMSSQIIKDYVHLSFDNLMNKYN